MSDDNDKIIQFPTNDNELGHYISEIQTREDVTYTLSEKIAILRGFDDMKDLPESELIIQAEKVPEEMAFYFMQVYQSEGIKTYREYAERTLGIIKRVIADKLKSAANPFNWFKRK